MKRPTLLLLLLLISSSPLFAQNVFGKMQNTTRGIMDADSPTRDQVILDDLIVDGSACVGFDCVDGESFGFDTVRLKENNVRIGFTDTSSTASFPGNDWEITINDSSNGGDNYFGITDVTGAALPFRVEAGAGTNALWVDSNGNIGIGEDNPVVEVHLTDGDTPTLRLQQDGSAGFGQQTWDLAGNETNFFVRDVTTNRLPFRIRAGAPANALVLATSGGIGVGTDNPNANVSLELASTTKGLQLNRLSTADRTALGTALGAETGVMVFDTDDSTVYIWNGTSWATSGGGTDDQIVDAFTLNGDNLELSLEDDGVAVNTVDLSGYLDNTDDQTVDAFALNGNSLELSLEDDGAAVNTVDLSGFLDNTDDQALSLNANSLDLEDGGSVDLTPYLDNTDDQALSLNANSLDLEDGGSVDLTPYLDNTDDQVLSLNANSLDLEDGGSVDLSPYLDNTDDQLLSLNGNSLDLEDGGSVDLTPYLDNTDNQDISGSSLIGTDLVIGITGGNSQTVDLSSLNDMGTDDQVLNLSGNTLSLEDGGSVDLSPFLDNTDDQLLANFLLSGPFLSISIQGGNVVSVDLSPILEELEDENSAQQSQINSLISENEAQQALIDDLIARVEAIEACACDGTLSVADFNVELDKPILKQNIPNPFDNSTIIGYFIPLNYSRANIVISDISGKILNNISITKFGNGEVVLPKDRMATAVYFYTLFVDGKRVDSKRMMVE